MAGTHRGRLVAGRYSARRIGWCCVVTCDSPHCGCPRTLWPECLVALGNFCQANGLSCSGWSGCGRVSFSWKHEDRGGTLGEVSTMAVVLERTPVRRRTRGYEPHPAPPEAITTRLSLCPSIILQEPHRSRSRWRIPCSVINNWPQEVSTSRPPGSTFSAGSRAPPLVGGRRDQAIPPRRSLRQP